MGQFGYNALSCPENGNPANQCCFHSSNVSYRATRILPANCDANAARLRIQGCNACRLSARHAASSLCLGQFHPNRDRSWSLPIVNDPRLSDGWKPLPEAGTCFFFNNTLCINVTSLYPNYPTLQISVTALQTDLKTKYSAPRHNLVYDAAFSFT